MAGISGKASIFGIAGIIMPAIYIFVYYNAGLYADFGINIYYLGAAIYGWTMWKYGAFLRRTILKRKASEAENRQQELPITRMPLRYLLPLVAVFAVTLAGIAWVLINFTDSNVPWLDSFYHRAQHCRHVDAGAQIRGAMVGMDRRRRCKHRSVHL